MSIQDDATGCCTIVLACFLSRMSPSEGPLAQLGERRVRNAEVVGSNPMRSTNIIRPYEH